MKINSDESLKTAARTFERFNGDWTAVYQNGSWEDGVFVVGAGHEPPLSEGKNGHGQADHGGEQASEVGTGSDNA